MGSGLSPLVWFYFVLNLLQEQKQTKNDAPKYTDNQNFTEVEQIISCECRALVVVLSRTGCYLLFVPTFNLVYSPWSIPLDVRRRWFLWRYISTRQDDTSVSTNTFGTLFDLAEAHCLT